MAPPKGNKFWEARTKHGRDKLFASAEALKEACIEYFEWVETNPLYEDRLVIFQGIAKHEPVAKMRAMTIAGLSTFLDIGTQTWYEWKKSDDFSEVILWAEQIIKDRSFQELRQTC